MNTIGPAAISLGILALLTQGCNPLKKNQPANEQIKAAIAAEAPPFLSVVDVTPEFIPGANDKQWTINVKVTLTSKEDLLSLPAPAEVVEINDLIHQNNDLLAWNSDFERTHQQDGLPSVRMETLKAPQLLVVKQQKQAGVAVYGKMSAEYQVDRWKLSTQLEFPFQGKPISSFGGSASDFLIKGSSTADEWLKNLHKVVVSNATKKREMIAGVERAANEKAEKLEAIKKSQRESLIAGASPGLQYVGIFTAQRTTEKVTVDFEKCEMNGSLLEFKLTSVANPNQWMRLRGRIEVNQQGMFYITAQYLESRVADKDNKQLQDFTAWWRDSNYARFINECKSLKFDKNQLIMEMDGATLNAERVKAP